MTQQEVKPSVPNERSWRSTIDTAASIALIALCGVGAWKLLGSNTPTHTEPPVPTALLSIDGAPTAGSASARVVLIDYSDFQCPFCGRFARDILPTIRRDYVDSGKIRIAFEELPLEKLHPHAFHAAVAADCAAQQGKFWAMHDALFADQQHLDEASVLSRVGPVGLAVEPFEACVSQDAESSKVRTSIDNAKTVNVTGTPTLFLGLIQSDGRGKVLSRLAGAQPVEMFRKAIDKALASVQ